MIKILDLNFLDTSETIGAFLVECEKEGPILFECGPHSSIHQLRSEIEKYGYKLSDIKHLFLTHIHFDHAGAAWELAKNGTKIYVHPKGVKHLIDPTRLYNSAARIYGDKMELLWGKMESISAEMLHSTQHKEIFKFNDFSIQAFHTPGHASHHIAWKIGNLAIVGDVAGCKIDGGPIMPPCPPPDINIEEWLESIELLLSLNLNEIYLTHFGNIQNVEEHMQILKSQLWNWANFIKLHFEKQTNQKELISLFTNFVGQQMVSEGVTNSELLNKYEKANPPWMSVAGLLRYWQIRLQI